MTEKAGAASTPWRLASGLLALASTLVLGQRVTADDDDAPGGPVGVSAGDTSEAAAAPAPAASSLALDRLQRGHLLAAVTNVFGGRGWVPPPAAAVPPPPPAPAVAAPPPAPAAPTVPPLPFTYIGRFAEEGQPTIYYLERAGQVVSVVAGQDLDANYRLESIGDAGLTFLYRPLAARQVLRTVLE